MKVRWRQHGILLMSLMAVALLAGLLIDSFRITSQQAENSYGRHFAEPGLSFSYTKNILLPQAAFILVLYICYLWINLFIVPFVKKAAENRSTGNLVPRIAL